MNPDTGHLATRSMITGLFPSEEEAKAAGYEPVPGHLQKAATAKLAGRTEATVSLTSGGVLSRWAASKRKKKAKAATAARRQNRHA